MNKIPIYLLKIPFLFFCSSLPFILSAQDPAITGELIRVVTEDSRDGWLEVRPEANLDKDAFLNLINTGDNVRGGSTANLTNSTNDEQGRTRHVYQQSFRGLPVENHLWLLHEERNRIFLAQGKKFDIPADQDIIPTLTENQALANALDSARATTYAWDVPTLEENLQTVKGDPNATHYPKGELVWTANKRGGDTQLAYKFEIYSVEPLARKKYYINAKTGQLIKAIDLINANCFAKDHAHHTHSTRLNHAASNNSFSGVLGTGIANYIAANGGNVSINTELDGSDYRLYTNTLGPSGTQVIHTQNANNAWNYNNLTDFQDSDNVWDTDPAAVGAHWGTEQVYNFYLNTFNRNSFDDEGSPILNVVHYGQSLINAFWDGTQMSYGDGNGTDWGALTSLDIIAHEITHGVTEHNGTGGLDYVDDSGALNESFSDIFGAVVEILYHPDGGNWLIGEDFDLAEQEGFRNMANPHLKNDPKTYLGLHWYDSTGDNGGVHTNSGVQNHWFYLLVEGGSGINEFGQSYNIAPIGMDKAAAITYYNLTHYMTPNATYQDAKDGAINAATILYPDDAAVQTAVVDAWCAVGIGTGCGPTIDVDEPAINEVVTAGKDYEVTWASNLLSTTSKVRIEYTTEEGTNPVWHFIADNVANLGTYNWLVPSAYGTTIRIRITDDGDPGTGRISNSDILGLSEPFEIEACTDPNSFAGATIVEVGEAVDFTSNITGDSYQWKIDGQEIAITQDLAYSFTAPGIYEVTYKVDNMAKGCFNEETKRLYALKENSNGFAIQIGDIDNGGGRAYSQEILRTNDGGYIFISLFTERVFKIDALGAVEWTCDVLPNPDYPNYRVAAIEKPDSNLLIVMGRSESGGMAPDDNLLIIEVDGTDGTVINNVGKQLAVDGRLMPFQIIATDSTYIIGGAYQNGTDQDVFLLQLKSDDLSVLNQVWIGDNGREDYYGDLIPTADGGFMLGWMQSGANPRYFGLIKLDENLQQEWRQGLSSNYVRPGVSSRMKIVEVPNCGGYMVLADADEYRNSALLKINTLGNVLWAKRYNTPDAFNGQLIPFQDMVWDGNEGVTLLGINGTALNSNAYPVAVDYQLLNVDFDGQMNWKRKVTDLNVILPTSPSYNLYTTQLLRAADGGYLAAIPGGDGGETHLIKTDSMGLDGCVMANTNINEEDISSSFIIEFDINTVLTSDPVIQPAADFTLAINLSSITVYTPKCGNVGNSLIAAFHADKYTIPLDTVPTITNLSRGATAYTWKIDGTPVSFPLPNFTNVGVYQLTLEATDGTATTSTTASIHVVGAAGCDLPCDLELIVARTITGTCPDTDDGQIYSEATSPIGRTFKYHLLNDADSLLAIQNTGFFTGLSTGDYQILVISDNDTACVLDMGTISLLPNVDNSPPKALCLSSEVDAAFVHAEIGVPYNHGSYVNEVTSALGQDWHEMIYETVDAQKLFSDSYNYIYMEGTDNNAEELETFMGANQQLMEDWVSAGNVLFVNAAPNEGDGMDFGFGGVQLVRGSYDSAFAATPALPMFSGPRTPVGTKFGGFPYNKAAIICPPGMDTTRVLTSKNGTDLLVQANWGAGTAMFGGMNLTGFHTPLTETYNFKINLHVYLKDLPIATVNSPLPLELDENDTYSLDVSEINLGVFDDCALLSVSLDTSEFTCANLGIFDVTLIATDVANNVATCTTQVEVFTAPTALEQVICQGDIHVFNNQNLTSAGEYRDTLQNANQCDSVLVLTLTVLDTSQTQLMANICEGDVYSFNDQILTTSGQYRDTLQNSNQCDSFLVLTLTLIDTSQTQLAESICEGTTYVFNEQNLSTSGVYRDTLQNVAQCDSFIVLTLTVLDTSQTQLAANICQGDVYVFNDQNLSSSGIYRDTLPNAAQCDSFIVLILTVLDTSQTQLVESICQGDIYAFNNQNLASNGTYRDTLQNVAQCDSFIVLNLTVLDTSQTQLAVGACTGDTYIFNGQALTTSGIYRDTLPNSNQCDSFLVLTFTISDTIQTQLTEQICEGEIHVFNDQNLSTSGVYRDTMQSISQCDSFIVLTLTVLDTSQTQLTQSICQGDIYSFNGQDLATSGQYRDTLQNTNQCDSFLVLTLTVIDTSGTQLTQNICQGETYSFNGESLTTSGQYRDTLQNVAQCDSFLVLTLIVGDTSQTQLVKQICQGDTYQFNGESLTTSGQYRDTLQNVAQCDSFLVLTLTMVDTSQSQLTQSICQGDTYSFNGQNLTASGQYRDTLQNVVQCDSFLVLTLTVVDTSQMQLTQSICQGDVYSFNGQSLTTSGQYRDTLQNSNQCDSFLVLTLMVIDTSQTQLTQSICQGGSYVFNGQNLTVDGIYRDTLQNTNQCDSFVVLTLTILDNSQTQLTDQICEGTTYDFNGQTLTSSGIYRDTLQNSNQCDSVLTLTLTVLPRSQTPLTASICQGGMYIFNGQNITVGGQYQATLQNSNQCDSIIALNLTVIPAPQTQIGGSICQGDIYNFNGQNLTVSGTYRDTVKNNSQCDSIIILTLSVNNCGNCIDHLILDNSPIAKGEYKGGLSISSAGVIAVDTVTYQAGVMITLKPGFHAPAGSDFLAKIAPCTTISTLTGEEIEVPVTSQRTSKNILDALIANELLVSPNPFYQRTKIDFKISTSQEVLLSVFSAEGQLIEVLQEGYLEEGQYAKYFDPKSRNGGVYLVVLQTEKKLLTQKIISLE